MKNIYLIIFLFSGFTQAQIVDIPDPYFKIRLLTYCCDLDGDGTYDGDADTNDDGEIQISEAESVYMLATGSPGISSLEGIQYFTNLEYLGCNDNQIEILDLSQNVNLKRLNCKSNNLKYLNISKNINLEYLNCSFNDNLLNLDVSQNPNLIELQCNYMPLTSLDISNNSNLEILLCNDNQISSLDVSQNPNLEVLRCDDNQIANLDVTQNLALIDLNCGDNPLNSLNVSQNINLEYLRCYENNLTSIDVSQNIQLNGLICPNNQITNIDVSQNPNLLDLFFNDNQLISLNIKNGNNNSINRMRAFNNSNLFCINVDDESASYQDCEDIPPYYGWCKDDWAIYSEDCGLSTEDFSLNSFSLYPNPTQDLLNIESQEPFDLVSIYSIEGVLVKETTNTSVNVSELPSGMYFVQIISEEKKVAKKFIKS